MRKRNHILLIFSLLLVAFLLTGCAKGDARDAFDQMMQGLKSGDAEQIGAYGGLPDGSGLIAEEKQEALFQAIFATMEKLEYTVTEAKREKNGAVVLTVNLKMVDHQAVIQDYIPRVQNLISNPNYQEGLSTMDLETYQGRLVQQMLDVLAGQDLPMIEQTTTITMIKENGAWVPSADKERIFDLMYLNLANAVLSLI